MARPKEFEYAGFEAAQDILIDVERMMDELYEKYGYEFLGTIKLTIQYIPEGTDEETP